MKKIILLSSLILTLNGCKVSPAGDGNKGKNGGDGKYEKGESIGMEYFETPIGSATYDSIDGLWRGEGQTKNGEYFQEALFFEGQNTLLQAVKCRKMGLEAYSIVRVPIQKKRRQITISKTVGRWGVVKDELTGQKYECKAELQKGTFYSIFVDGLKICLSSKADCKGKKEYYEKIRDKM